MLHILCNIYCSCRAYDLGQKYYAPQVRPDWDSNSWPPDLTWQYTSCHWDACSAISDFLTLSLVPHKNLYNISYPLVPLIKSLVTKKNEKWQIVKNLDFPNSESFRAFPLSNICSTFSILLVQSQCSTFVLPNAPHIFQGTWFVLVILH